MTVPTTGSGRACEPLLLEGDVPAGAPRLRDCRSHLPCRPSFRVDDRPDRSGRGRWSTLTGALKLREVVTMHDLRSIKSWMFLQPLVGASAALLVLLLVNSSVIGLPRTRARPCPGPLSPPTGFIAGFSEPFFLGVVKQTARAADEKGG